MSESNKKTVGFKGFNADLKCHDYQFKIGESHEHEGYVKLCEKGFHFCENPLDVLDYYDPVNSRFAEVEAQEVDDKTDSDSKRVCRKLFVKAELTLSALISAGVKFILEKVDFKNSKESNTGNWSAATNTGNWSAATNTGDWSAATNTGNRSAATNTGNWSAATNTGKEGCAISLGIEGKAKGSKRCWLTIAEWEQVNGEWHRIDVKTVKVDGKKIKADIFYVLKKGEFVIAEAQS
jgi:hypothetical protein